MLKITHELVMSSGQNPAAVKNGAALVKKGSFSALYIDKDSTIIFGAMQGSGAKPYHCSADFIDSEAPVFRCSCPSRQIPCKHVLGLMWAYAEGHKFSTESIPDDVVQKRANKEKRAAEKQKAAPKPVNSDSRKKTAVKKIETQLNGLNEGEKLLNLIVESGIGSADAKAMAGYLSVVKQLDSYYIGGVQNEFFALLELIKSDEGLAAAKICGIQALLNKSKQYLQEKKNAPDKPDTASEIEEAIGYAWKLEELKQHGLVEEADIVQLAFHVVNEPDKKQFVDIGYYVCLNSGRVYLSKNFRPYKAVKHIKEANSISTLIHTDELCIYPSASMNARVRWSAADFAKLTPEICSRINALGSGDFAVVIKSVKNQLKNLMLDPLPVALMRFSKIYKAADGCFVIEDKSGYRVLLKENKYFDENFMHLLNDIKPDSSEGSILAAFYCDISKDVLAAHPLALVTDNKIVKLLY